MAHTVHLSNGASYVARLVVANVATFGGGAGEVRGFRLWWMNPDESGMTPEGGLATSNPFRTERDAIAYGERRYGERAQRLTR